MHKENVLYVGRSLAKMKTLVDDLHEFKLKG